VGTVAGLGIGHAIHGDYSSNGWKFSVIDGVAMASITAGIVMAATGSSAGKIFYLGGVGVLLGSHGWQAYELWPRAHLSPKGSRTSRESKYTPLIVATDKGGMLGMSLRF
jgi:hypothetical protein